MSSLLSAEMVQNIGRLGQSLWLMMCEQATGRSCKCWITNISRVCNKKSGKSACVYTHALALECNIGTPL